MVRASVLALSLVATACGVELSGGAASTDAAPGQSGSDAATGAFEDAAVEPEPDAAPACFNGRVVYLNFEGVTLTRGTSDATQNRAAWLQRASGTAPKYRANSASRLTDIQQITDGIRQQLADFPITVVTERPATGPYVMIVFGGTAQDVASFYGAAVNQLDCGDAQKSDVAWIADAVSPNQRVINVAIGAIGFGLGLTATTDPLDCMCGWANSCSASNTGACRLTDNIARDPNATQLCPNVTTQNETQTFREAFCE
jgi:hypothetical protein